jgi:hypothetical protein
VRIAALLMAHTRPDLVAALVDRLSTPLWKVYIHVDLKTEIKPFLRLSDRAVFLTKRERVSWGGFSLVKATLLLLRQAYVDEQNSHFYLMSGQCFPIKRDEEIRKFLEGPGCVGNLMSTERMPVSHKPLWRLTRRHHNDIQSESFRYLVHNFFRLLPARSVDRLLRGLAPWAGSTWWMLNRQTIGEILDFLLKNPWYLRAFQYTHCPDESFFQTLVHHLAITLDGPSPTIAKWQEKRHPEIITPNILEEFTRSWHFAARKFDQAPLGSISNGH